MLLQRLAVGLCVRGGVQWEKNFGGKVSSKGILSCALHNILNLSTSVLLGPAMDIVRPICTCIRS
jgi:hypothetical protein